MKPCDMCGKYGCDCYSIIGRCTRCGASLNVGDFDNGQCMTCGSQDIVEAIIGEK
ncbi:MAG: hypothetical protein K5790_10140 [Nitrosopumilus sp.]|uniref:hypothetical protein n=1 Tax=Nitrosopumilus sp. TaxID=2024843 RepID=UPI00247E0889|nr:hypothetical protein [Nitrosopumilus sp.]MCV0393628.1 hypothetical protein [Nitrosopumilus sp.]